MTHSYTTSGDLTPSTPNKCGITEFIRQVFAVITHLDRARHDTLDTATDAGKFTGRSG